MKKYLIAYKKSYSLYTHAMRIEAESEDAALDVFFQMAEAAKLEGEYISIIGIEEDIETKHREYIGSLLKDAREKRDYTLRELAEELGISYATLCNIENGKYNVTIDLLNKICGHLSLRFKLEDKVYTKM